MTPQTFTLSEVKEILTDIDMRAMDDKVRTIIREVAAKRGIEIFERKPFDPAASERCEGVGSSTVCAQSECGKCSGIPF